MGSCVRKKAIIWPGRRRLIGYEVKNNAKPRQRRYAIHLRKSTVCLDMAGPLWLSISPNGARAPPAEGSVPTHMMSGMGSFPLCIAPAFGSPSVIRNAF